MGRPPAAKRPRYGTDSDSKVHSDDDDDDDDGDAGGVSDPASADEAYAGDWAGAFSNSSGAGRDRRLAAAGRTAEGPAAAAFPPGLSVGGAAASFGLGSSSGGAIPDVASRVGCGGGMHNDAAAHLAGASSAQPHSVGAASSSSAAAVPAAAGGRALATASVLQYSAQEVFAALPAADADELAANRAMRTLGQCRTDLVALEDARQAASNEESGASDTYYAKAGLAVERRDPEAARARGHETTAALEAWEESIRALSAAERAVAEGETRRDAATQHWGSIAARIVRPDGAIAVLRAAISAQIRELQQEDDTWAQLEADARRAAGAVSGAIAVAGASHAGIAGLSAGSGSSAEVTSAELGAGGSDSAEGASGELGAGGSDSAEGASAELGAGGSDSAEGASAELGAGGSDSAEGASAELGAGGSGGAGFSASRQSEAGESDGADSGADADSWEELSE